ncbi:hypothetical protein A1Q1_07951 [Trichosporon asahii var. asahii CBS 2479]|uniref:Major facilitator superfamily (MFS) profile domain-containing protein n=1 Tax=Trichosporon asahii var. asahii (strain ATCC 90039 / CBS 2479 / JCM 2466 / KCTC 7840 / NBRC 103889/ NCYC 2677 / UAMH 7654) TaxID=1186058 RepID=J6F1Q1_TRIAS|nr:hypothetical protein A1Q1_07951 [Trichosporon asahii var. asahii CBS 2479]EJT50889.1 hypothetical protein A1Q1_07951 [Trichosporon asahii var. asahii CBS 2479]
MLAKYHANGDMDDELVLWELKEINRALEIEKMAKNVGYSEFFKTKGNRKRLFIILFVGFSAQWVGNGIISFYVVSILESAGITNPTDQTAYNGGLQIWNWFSAIGGGLVCERFGRRKMWLTSSIGQFFSYAVITLCSALYANGHAKAGYPVLASLFVYFFFYSIAFTPLLLAYPIEILPYTLRSKGVSILLFCTLTATMLNTFVNPLALEALEWKYYFVFLGMIVIVTIVIYFYYPETQGHSLEEIAVIFDGPAAKTTADDDDDFVAPEERRGTLDPLGPRLGAARGLSQGDLLVPAADEALELHSFGEGIFGELLADNNIGVLASVKPAGKVGQNAAAEVVAERCEGRPLVLVQLGAVCEVLGHAGHVVGEVSLEQLGRGLLGQGVAEAGVAAGRVVAAGAQVAIPDRPLATRILIRVGHAALEALDELDAGVVDIRAPARGAAAAVALGRDKLGRAGRNVPVGHEAAVRGLVPHVVAVHGLAVRRARDGDLRAGGVRGDDAAAGVGLRATVESLLDGVGARGGDGGGKGSDDQVEH